MKNYKKIYHGQELHQHQVINRHTDWGSFYIYTRLPVTRWVSSVGGNFCDLNAHKIFSKSCLIFESRQKYIRSPLIISCYHPKMFRFLSDLNFPDKPLTRRQPSQVSNDFPCQLTFAIIYYLTLYLISWAEHQLKEYISLKILWCFV